MQGVPNALLRQPAEVTWRQQGVGQFTCKTRLYSQQPANMQYTEHVVSGSAAIMLVKLQLQYLVFLKQSDSIRGLRQKAEPVTVQ